MNINRQAHHYLLGSLTLALLTACGGGGGGGDDGIASGGGTSSGGINSGIAGGGIGGTGVGTVTGFGSIIINDTREFAVNNETVISIDDVAAAESDLRRGMVVRFDIADDVNPGFTGGTAVNIIAGHQVKGPVSSVNPLRVLEQAVVVTGTTVLDAIPGGTVANLAIGDSVEVSGFTDHNGVIQAARLEYKPTGLSLWKIVGSAGGVMGPGRFMLGSLDISLNGTVPRDCSGGLQNGDLVEVKATPDASWSSGGILGTVTQVECQSNALSSPDNPSGSVIEGEIEGFVTAVLSAVEFSIGQQRIVHGAGTEFKGGNITDIVVGVKLEAEGDFNTATGILRADEIHFRETRVRIEAPLNATTVVPGVSLELMGIRVIATPRTEDKDGILTGRGGNRQVEVRGFIDGSGAVVAEELRERGNADFTDVRLRGPVSNIVPTTFEILGITADTATARSITDDNENAIDSDTFFSLISTGTPVEIQDANWDGATRLDNGKIEIED